MTAGTRGGSRAHPGSAEARDTGDASEGDSGESDTDPDASGDTDATTDRGGGSRPPRRRRRRPAKATPATIRQLNTAPLTRKEQTAIAEESAVGLIVASTDGSAVGRGPHATAAGGVGVFLQHSGRRTTRIAAACVDASPPTTCGRRLAALGDLARCLKVTVPGVGDTDTAVTTTSDVVTGSIEEWGVRNTDSATNQRAELAAIAVALIEATARRAAVHVRTDSEYARQVVSGETTAKEHRDIVATIAAVLHLRAKAVTRGLIRGDPAKEGLSDGRRRTVPPVVPSHLARARVRISWVRGHAGDAGNTVADALAGDAARAAGRRASETAADSARPEAVPGSRAASSGPHRPTRDECIAGIAERDRRVARAYRADRILRGLTAAAARKLLGHSTVRGVDVVQLADAIDDVARAVEQRCDARAQRESGADTAPHRCTRISRWDSAVHAAADALSDAKIGKRLLVDAATLTATPAVAIAAVRDRLRVPLAAAGLETADVAVGGVVAAIIFDEMDDHARGGKNHGVPVELHNRGGACDVVDLALGLVAAEPVRPPAHLADAPETPATRAAARRDREPPQRAQSAPRQPSPSPRRDRKSVV